MLCLSAVGTLGTAYYLISDGGDSEAARARLNATVEKAKTATQTVTATLKNATDGGAVELEKLTRKDNDKESGRVASLSEEGIFSPSHDSATRSGDGRTRTLPDFQSSVCHHCSGPRIWFFAEKLGVMRLKRRFTPYSDSESEKS